MRDGFVVRRPSAEEYAAIRDLIRRVADDTFGTLFAPNPVPLKIDAIDWSAAWVAASGGEILGVILTRDEWVSDLWVHRDRRRSGVGRTLLAQGEAEIANRGHETARLRVVKSNDGAVRFYLRQGWSVGREFPHEQFGHAMLELTKPVLRSEVAK